MVNLNFVGNKFSKYKLKLENKYLSKLVPITNKKETLSYLLAKTGIYVGSSLLLYKFLPNYGLEIGSLILSAYLISQLFTYYRGFSIDSFGLRDNLYYEIKLQTILLIEKLYLKYKNIVIEDFKSDFESQNYEKDALIEVLSSEALKYTDDYEKVSNLSSHYILNDKRLENFISEIPNYNIELFVEIEKILANFLHAKRETLNKLFVLEYLDELLYLNEILFIALDASEENLPQIFDSEFQNYIDSLQKELSSKLKFYSKINQIEENKLLLGVD